MSLWSVWRKESEIRRRLRRMQAGVRECLADPSCVPEVCRALGMARETLEPWLRAAKGESSPPLLRAERLPGDAAREEVRDRQPSPQTAAADAFAERVRRLIVLLLELPLARRNPEIASDFVVQLADLAARHDMEELGQLEAALDWVTRLAPNEPVKRGVEIPQRGRIAAEGLRLAGSSDESRRMPFLVAKRVATSIERILYSALGRFRIADHRVARLRIFERIHARLETFAGTPEAESSRAASLNSFRRESSSPTQAECDLLVLTRPRFRRLLFELADTSHLSMDMLRQVIQEEPDRPPDLFWRLEEGTGLWAPSDPGEKFPDAIDVAWVQPEPVTDSFSTISPTQDVLESERLLKHPAEVVEVLAELGFEDTPAGDLAEILAASDALAQPDLAVQLAGAVCRNQGTLGWETCLSLANSRSRFHRYTESGNDARWRVQVGVRPGSDGAIEIPFAVVEQPLSVRFRQLFEAADLAGRVRILWQLVAYASQLHTSLLTLTAAQAERQVALREDELWKRLGERRDL